MRFLRLHFFPKLLLCPLALLFHFFQSHTGSFFGQNKFRCRINRNFFQIFYGTLAFRIKTADGIYFIPPHFNPIRIVLRQRVHVQNPAAHREFSRRFCLIILHIPHLHKLMRCLFYFKLFSRLNVQNCLRKIIRFSHPVHQCIKCSNYRNRFFICQSL